MKGITFNHVKDRLESPRSDLPEHECEHYIKLTSILIKRSYMHTAKLVQNWPLEKIKERYWNCMKDTRSAIPRDVRWWSLSKREIVND